MSYDVNLCDPVTGMILEAEQAHMMAGGTYAVGGTAKMWINITYNYGGWYRKDYAFGEDGIRSIEGLTGAESIPVLKSAITGLTQRDEDISEEVKQEYIRNGVSGYWLPTRENAIKPLHQLLAFAQMRPDGVWMID